MIVRISVGDNDLYTLLVEYAKDFERNVFADIQPKFGDFIHKLYTDEDGFPNMERYMEIGGLFFDNHDADDFHDHCFADTDESRSLSDEELQQLTAANIKYEEEFAKTRSMFFYKKYATNVDYKALEQRVHDSFMYFTSLNEHWKDSYEYVNKCLNISFPDAYEQDNEDGSVCYIFVGSGTFIIQ